jgi:hypothetical protein
MSAARKVPRARPTGGQLTPAVESIRVGDTQPPAQSQTPEVPESRSAAVPEKQTPRAPESRRAPAGADDTAEPKFARLLRKEARIRYDQARALTDLRRRLSRGRANRDEVITDNTLIRVAVDLLLARADQLAGDTEDELRTSVLPESETP